MADTIVIGGTEFPAKITIDGRSCTRKANLSDIILGDVFGRLYKGPFTTTLETGEPIPSCCHIDPVETKEGIKKSFLLYDDVDDERACCIKDSNGRDVAVARSIVAACQIVDALNRQPEGFKDGFETGMSCNGGMNRHLKENKFMFWAVLIKSVEYNPLDHSRVGYLSPFDNRYKTPAICTSPMSAIRFSSKQMAMRFIEIVNDIKKNFVQIVHYIEGNEKEPSYIKRWDWDSMEPVLIQFAYNVLR